MDREVIHKQFIHAFICIYASQVMLVVKNLPANVGRHEKQGFEPWEGKTDLWRRAWQHTPLFLPGESHGQRSLAGFLQIKISLEYIYTLFFIVAVVKIIDDIIVKSNMCIYTVFFFHFLDHIHIPFFTIPVIKTFIFIHLIISACSYTYASK